MSSVPIEILEQADLAHRQIARKHPDPFIEYVLRDEETGGLIQQASVHSAWQQMLSEYKRVVLWSSIESGKTQQVSIGRVLWELGRNTNLRVAIVSNTREQSIKIIRAVAKYIDVSAETQLVFPELRRADPWTSSQLFVERDTVSKDPSVQCFGVHGNVLGARIDLLILDDVLDYENCRTPALREDLWSWYHATLAGRLTRKSRVWIVGTAFHPDDALHRFARQAGWHAVRYPVVDPETGLPRWPERWPLSRVEEWRNSDPTGIEFARQLLCQARDNTTSRFKKEWIDKALKRGNGKRLLASIESVPPGCRVYTGVDLGVQKHAAAGSTVLFTILVHPNEDREVIGIEAGKWGGPEIISRIIDASRRYMSIMIVENNACFPSGTRVLTKRGYRPIESIKVGDEVWTHAARWRKVIDTLVGTSRVLTTARAKGCLPVHATPNHWFLLRRAGRVKGGRKTKDVGKHRPVGKPEWISYGFRDESSYVAVAVPEWSPEEPALRLKATAMKVQRKIEVDEDLALVLGLFMAEGHATKGQVFWTLGSGEGYLADFICRVLKEKLGKRPTQKRLKSTLRIVFSDVQLAAALHIGTGAGKCLPLLWMGWPLPVRVALVRGWFMGDGCARVNNGKTRWPAWFLSGVSVSRDWMLFVRATLAHMGLATALRVHAPRDSYIEGRRLQRQPLFEVSLAWKGSRRLRAAMITNVEARHWAKWWQSDRRQIRHGHDGHIVLGNSPHGWSRVPEIEEAPYEEWGAPVYNLVVEEDESFTVEDFIVHNAQDFIVQFAQAASAVPIKPFTTGRNKAHPEFGVEALAAEMAGGKWIIPNLDGHMDPEISAWVSEMLYYDPMGHTGDRLMGSWFAREGSRMGQQKVEYGRINLTAR